MGTLNILVVDDSATASLFLKHKLATLLGSDLKSSVTIAETGEKALEIILEKSIDLVVLDAVLPGMDGYAVCRRIKDIQPRARIAMLTALTADSDEQKGFDSGCDHYIRKPASDEMLQQIMRIAGQVKALEQ